MVFLYKVVTTDKSPRSCAMCLKPTEVVVKISTCGHVFHLCKEHFETIKHESREEYVEAVGGWD